jgi:hypothetical protein
MGSDDIILPVPTRHIVATGLDDVTWPIATLLPVAMGGNDIIPACSYCG